VVVEACRAGLVGELQALAVGGPATQAVGGAKSGDGKRAVLVTGKGSELPGMGKALCGTLAVFRGALDAVFVAFEGELGTGSGRSIAGFDLLNALHAAAPHLDRYGGHSAAAGLTIQRDRLQTFRDAIELHAAEALTPDVLDPAERIDAIVEGGGGEAQGLLNVSFFELWELREQLATIRICGKQFQNPPYSESHSANAWMTTALFRIYGDTV